MSKKCEKSGALLDRLFSDDRVAKPTDAERAHAAQCADCAAALKKAERLETLFQAEKEDVAREFPDVKFKFPAESPTQRAKETKPEGSFLESLRQLFFPTFALAAAAVLVLFMIRIQGRPASPGGTNALTGVEKALGLDEGILVDGRMAAAGGNEIKIGETFSFGVKEFVSFGKARLRLGSEVQIDAVNARFAFSPAGLSLQQGTVEVWVPKKEKRIIFSASTPTVTIGVRGTIFKVAYLEDKKTRVSVREGLVHVATIAGGDSDLAAGESLEVESDGSIKEPISRGAETSLSTSTSTVVEPTPTAIQPTASTPIEVIGQ